MKRSAAAQTRIDTANKLPAFLRKVEKIVETWDAPDGAPTPYEPDAADLLTGLVQDWREFTSANPVRRTRSKPRIHTGRPGWNP